MGFSKGSQVRDPLLDSITEHAKLFAQERTDLQPDEIHEALETAVDRGLAKFDTARIYKPEVRPGERPEDDPIHTVTAAADRCLAALHKRCRDRTEFDD